MSKQTKDWMEKLVENYKLPPEKETSKKEPNRILKESQLKKILNRD
jgi:hypothetical protein